MSTNREHFRSLYQRNPDDLAVNPEAGKAVFSAAGARFGTENFRYDHYIQRGSGPDFPVLTHDRRIASSLALSETLKSLPVLAVDYVFVAPQFREEAERWLAQNRKKIIKLRKKGKKHGKT